MILSVVIPTNVYDDLLLAAVDSILRQNISAHEIIIVANGQNRKLVYEKLKKKYISENKIKLLETGISGISYSLNLGVDVAQGEYVARMDADDLSLPNRFEAQLKELENNPEVSLIGTNISLINNGTVIGRTFLPNSDKKIRFQLRFKNPIAHPSVIFRKNLVKEVGGYSNSYRCEDYELWLRLCRHKKTKFCNLEDTLVLYNHKFVKGQRKSHDIYIEMASLQFREAILTASPLYFFGCIYTLMKAIWVRFF